MSGSVGQARHPLGGRRALVVWGTSVLAYAVAVFHRSSLATAGIAAAERFGIGPSALATFVILQLLVYAALQVPVGTLLDRYGSRRLLVVGALLMAAGQLTLALAYDLPLALAARVLLGAGDAMTFISVVRIASQWFPPERNPLVVQLTGVIGQLGALVSAVPLLVLLRGVGWTGSYAAAAGVGAGVAVLIALLVRDSPYRQVSQEQRPVSIRGIRRDLLLAWHEPGTRLGLWSHFVTQFSGLVFVLLWGYPFLTTAQGLDPEVAGSLLGLLIVAGIAIGPLLSRAVSRYPFHRSTVVLGIVVVTAASWTTVLAWPGRAPLAVLVVLVLVLGVNGPGSMIGFDFARTFNPTGRLGTATGIVNVGGFVASLATIGLVGLVLDVVTAGPAAAAPLSSYRLAFATQYVVWAVGARQVWRYRVRARRALAARDPEAYAVLRRGPAARHAALVLDRAGDG